jgi:hypothetical protein
MFRRTYCLHFQGGTVSQARKQHKQGQIQLIYTVFLGLHFDPEDGGNMFLRNFTLSLDY